MHYQFSKMVSLLLIFLVASCSDPYQEKNQDFFLKNQNELDRKKREEEYGLATIGELPIEKSIADMIRIFITQPFGSDDYIVKMSRFSGSTLICKKEITGYGLSRNYQETCQSFEPVQMDSLWQKSVDLVTSKRQSILQKKTGNDDAVARIELAKGVENIIIEVSLCNDNDWPVLLANEISIAGIDLNLPDCH